MTKWYIDAKLAKACDWVRKAIEKKKFLKRTQKIPGSASPMANLFALPKIYSTAEIRCLLP